MNHTLFFKINPSIKYPAWDTDSHYKFLLGQKLFKTKRSYERWLEKLSIFPVNLNLNNYLEIHKSRVNKLIHDYFIKKFEKQRSLILFVQYIEVNNTKFLFANDRRNGRLWVKVKSKKINDISDGLKYFSKLRKKNIIIFPDINLLNSFVEEKINAKLVNYKLKLSLIHI